MPLALRQNQVQTLSAGLGDLANGAAQRSHQRLGYPSMGLRYRCRLLLQNAMQVALLYMSCNTCARSPRRQPAYLLRHSRVRAARVGVQLIIFMLGLFQRA